MNPFNIGDRVRRIDPEGGYGPALGEICTVSDIDTDYVRVQMANGKTSEWLRARRYAPVAQSETAAGVPMKAGTPLREKATGDIYYFVRYNSCTNDLLAVSKQPKGEEERFQFRRTSIELVSEETPSSPFKVGQLVKAIKCDGTGLEVGRVYKVSKCFVPSDGHKKWCYTLLNVDGTPGGVPNLGHYADVLEAASSWETPPSKVDEHIYKALAEKKNSGPVQRTAQKRKAGALPRRKKLLL